MYGGWEINYPLAGLRPDINSIQYPFRSPVQINHHQALAILDMLLSALDEVYNRAKKVASTASSACSCAGCCG